MSKLTNLLLGAIIYSVIVGNCVLLAGQDVQSKGAGAGSLDAGAKSVLGSRDTSDVIPVVDDKRMVPDDLAVQNRPIITKVEAFAGRPLGIGRVSFRMRTGDELVLRTGSAMLRESNKRILYPVMTKSPLVKFIQNISGTQPTQPNNVHTIWFLFRGDEPLDISILGSGLVSRQIDVEIARPRQFDRFLTQWWDAFNKAAETQMEWGDYPALVESYLTAMLSRRLDLPIRYREKKRKDPLGETFDLLFDVESIRTDAIYQSMAGSVDTDIANLPLPEPIRWTPTVVNNLPAEIEIEAIAKCVPQECFYLRFGTWKNQLWLTRLMKEYGGDLGRMVSLRGYKETVESKFLDQLAIRSSEFDELFGGNLISDVAVIGNDTYFGEGSAVGVVLHARNSKALQRNLNAKRKKFAAEQKGAKLEEVQFGETTIQFLSTPDNRYRSFYVVHGDFHLTTTSLELAKRFVQSAGGDRSLGDSSEFRYARYMMPLERDDTVFVYLSTAFYQSLLSPQYQIELRRRNRVVADMQLLEIARLAARTEGYDAKDMTELIRHGFLASDFGIRPDHSQIEFDGIHWYDTSRGQRGFFTPIPDVDISSVTKEEVDWFSQRASLFTNRVSTLQPAILALKRYQHETKENIERVVMDARVAPFGEEKFGWLVDMAGPPLKQMVKPLPNEIISFQASMTGGELKPNVPVHILFGGIQDDLNFPINLQPTSVLDLYDTVRTAPGYLGAYPKPGYLDWMRNLGGVPDEEGFTYSRLFKLWRLQFGDFSILGFDKERLRGLRPHLDIIEAERAAQVRIRVGDLKESGLNTWADSMNYRRAWQTSIANVQLINTLIDQFDVPPADARDIAERMLNVRLVCSLDGEYQLATLPNGRQLWHSTAWPSFANPELPQNYSAPLLKWFRGMDVEISKVDSQYQVHAILDIQRNQEGGALPSFNLFKGFGNFFSGDKQPKPGLNPSQKNKNPDN